MRDDARGSGEAGDTGYPGASHIGEAMSDDKRLEEIRERLATISFGEWSNLTAWKGGSATVYSAPPGHEGRFKIAECGWSSQANYPRRRDNASFIASTPKIINELLALVDTLRAEICSHWKRLARGCGSPRAE